jgi:hypothetical protein
MNIREFAKPVTSKSLNESLAARFGQKLKLESFTLEQLQDVRNRIRTKLSQVETNESFDSVHNETYQKSKLMLDVLNAAISERGDISDEPEERKISEGAEDTAELVMASKEMVEKLTGWMEDTAEMQSQSMLELADAIRDEMGMEAADAFTGAVKPALDSLYSAMEQTRVALIGGVSQLTGEGDPMNPMGADDPMSPDMYQSDGDANMDPAGDMDMDMDMDPAGGDEFGAAAPAAGGELGADRARRESRETSKKKPVTEISKGKAVDYIKKASPQADADEKKGRSFPGAADGTGKPASKRRNGVNTAAAKIIGRAKVSATESRRLASILSKKK